VIHRDHALRQADSDSVNLGSNPSSPASTSAYISTVTCLFRTLERSETWERKAHVGRTEVGTVRRVVSPLSKYVERIARLSMIGRSVAGERSLHTGEVVGSIPTAPTIRINYLARSARNRAHVSPKISAHNQVYDRASAGTRWTNTAPQMVNQVHERDQARELLITSTILGGALWAKTS
jgi:hypothetical protein